MTKSIDDVIQGALAHGAHPYTPALYDPQKAHEYYMRTRDLKGRRKGSAEEVGKGRGPAKAQASSAKLSPSTQKQIANLTERLHALQARLRELMSNAKKSGDAKKKDDGHKTASDKTKDARESKKYREKHKAELAQKAKKADDKKSGSGSGGGHSKGIGSMTETQVRAAIKQVKADLHAAVAKARRG